MFGEEGKDEVKISRLKLTHHRLLFGIFGPGTALLLAFISL
jgi:hypothetical protein